MDNIIQDIYQSILTGEKEQVEIQVREAMANGASAESILNEGMVAAMGEVGRLFEEGEYFIPDMLIAAQAMQTGLEVLKPTLVQENFQPAGKIVIGTVFGDIHDIGKNLVAMIFKGSAYEVHDLGVDVPPERFVEAVQETGAQFVAVSALLTTTMVNMKAVVQAFESAGMRDQVKILVGGAPLTAHFAEQIGADGYSPDASRAVRLVQSFGTS